MMYYTISYSQNENYLITKKGERVDKPEHIGSASHLVIMAKSLLKVVKQEWKLPCFYPLILKY